MKPVDLKFKLAMFAFVAVFNVIVVSVVLIAVFNRYSVVSLLPD